MTAQPVEWTPDGEWEQLDEGLVDDRPAPHAAYPLEETCGEWDDADPPEADLCAHGESRHDYCAPCIAERDRGEWDVEQRDINRTGRALQRWNQAVRTADRSIRRMNGQLERIYGSKSWKLSQKAQRQPRDARGRFIKAPEPAMPTTVTIGAGHRYTYSATGSNMITITVPHGWNPIHDWNAGRAVTVPAYQNLTFTAPARITYGPTPYTLAGTMATTANYTITTTGTIGGFRVTNPEIWRYWRDEARQTYTVEAGYNDGYTHRWYVTDEEVEAHNPNVYQRWNVIAETDVQAFARIEAREREAQEARERANQRALEVKRHIEGAHERALELLELCLTEEERTLWENTHQIHVRGSDGEMYVIDTNLRGGSVHGNIRRVDGHGCTLAVCCGAPEMTERHPELGHLALPVADGWLGQYLTLKHNAQELLQKGNWYGYAQCRTPNVPILERAA